MTTEERAEIEALLKRWQELAADAYYRVKGGHALAPYYGGLQFGLELAAEELAALLSLTPAQQPDGDEQQPQAHDYGPP
jgi:hypothetical protein